MGENHRPYQNSNEVVALNHHSPHVSQTLFYLKEKKFNSIAFYTYISGGAKNGATFKSAVFLTGLCSIMTIPTSQLQHVFS